MLSVLEYVTKNRGYSYISFVHSAFVFEAIFVMSGDSS